MTAKRPDWRAYWKDRLVVYRCYDASGALLYIGETGNWPVRMQTHRSLATSFWWPLVHKIRIQLVHPPANVTYVEKMAIRTERPLYNLWENHHPSEHAAKILEWDQQFPGAAQAFRERADKVLRQKRRRQAREAIRKAPR